MQINRLFQMIHLLMNEKRTTAAKLADHFQVSERTIYRDIEKLEHAGVPIVTFPGRDGGIGLAEGLVLNKTSLTQDERNEILLGLQGLSGKEYAKAAGLLERLGYLFHNSTSNWIQIDDSFWGEAHKKSFETLKEGILGGKTVCFDYYNSQSHHSFRTVDPLQLWFKGMTWYLRGWCHSSDEICTFQVSRIWNLSFTGDHFEHGYVKPPEPEKNNKQKMIHLSLCISLSQLFRIYDEFPIEDIRIREYDILVEHDFEKSDWLYSYLLSYGDQLEVVKPQNIRKEMKKKIASLTKIYSQNKD